MIDVAINGYGTIGKRVADAVAEQPDMQVLGVAKTRPNYEAQTAIDRGYPLYAAIPDRAGQFDEAGMPIDGPVEELIEAADIVVDATPGGVGEQNRSLYEEYDTPAIYQGGEDAEVADVSFTARANYEDAIGASHVRVVSCNTTGLARLIAPLEETFGVEKVRVTLVRRGGDPSQTGRGPINDILPNPVTLPSHHGPDVNTIYPDLDIDTLGMKVPATLMHVHSFNATLESTPTADEVRDALADERRLFLVPETFDIDGSGKLKEYGNDVGRPRGDLWENCIWDESISTVDRDFYCFQAIHQESDVVPENIDAIRAMMETADASESVELTDDALGVGL